VARQLGADTVVASSKHAQPPATNVGSPSDSSAYSADADEAARGRTRRQLTGSNRTAQYAYHCTKEPSTEHTRAWWEVFKELAEALGGELDVPYQLESGTLLNFRRDCEILSNDIDITVPLEWWQTGDNLHRLQGAMFKRHFKVRRATNKGTFKTTQTYGYEEQYTYDKHGDKHYRVDIFASIPHPGAEKKGHRLRALRLCAPHRMDPCAGDRGLQSAAVAASSSFRPLRRAQLGCAPRQMPGWHARKPLAVKYPATLWGAASLPMITA